jgi:hypothetical protein
MSIVKLNNNGVKNATEFGSITGLGQLIFIKKITASTSSTVSFVDGSSDVVLDDTYKEYLFTFNNIHPSNDSANVQFQVSINTGSSYGVAITSTYFQAQHEEGDSETALEYDAGQDLAQGTGFQTILAKEVGNGNDESASGYLHLFDPSSTTFVKHFMARGNCQDAEPMSRDGFTAGYVNTTSAVDAIQFKMSAGTIDAGDICLYGIV